MRREFNEIEYLNWCLGQPYNMVAAVRVRGGLQPDLLRAALDKAQQRHPLLGVNTEVGPAGLPWFDSAGVGPIPLTVIDQADLDHAQTLAESELETPFAMDSAGASRLPLIRVTLLLPRDSTQPADLVITVQHVIADGLSMVFLVRDLLHFMTEPGAPVAVLDAPARPDDVLPAKVRKRIPTSPLRFRVFLGLAQAYVRLRFGRQAGRPHPQVQYHRSWELTVEQTNRLKERCHREAVSVQSAVCTAFLSGFSAVHIPVSLRSLLARPVGESVGLFVGAAQVKMPYRDTRGFWDNARRFQHRMRRALRDPFWLYRLFSKVVPVEMVKQLGPLLVAITSNQRPFAVTNLGQLDGKGVPLEGRTLQIESFSGAVTGIVESSVLTAYTLGGRLRLHLLAAESAPVETRVRDDAERAVQRLIEALDP